MRWWKVNIFLVIGLMAAATACAPVPNMGGDGQPCNNVGSCLPGLVCDTSRTPPTCVKSLSDGGLLPPVISGIDGDGTELPVVCPDAGPCNGTKATHRFQTKWVVSGLRLDTVTNAKLEGSQSFSVSFEEGGTPMKRNMPLPITLVAGLFTLTLTNPAGDATAETYILQGEKGDPGTFTGQFTGNVTFTGNMSLSGTATLNTLNVTGTYTLPECPEGYTQDATATGYTLCFKGDASDRTKRDEMVKVGDFWIDKYEAVITDDSGYIGGNCSSLVQLETSPYTTNTYGARTDNWDLVGDLDQATGRTKFTGTASIPIYACSTRGFQSSRYLTWFQAQEACAASGKELCTNEQWQAAVAGTYDPGPTGASTGGQCNIFGSDNRKNGQAGNTLDGKDSCISKYGVEDMIGNLTEWVSMWGQGGPDNGVANGAYTGVWNSNPAISTGFGNFSPETSGNGDGTWNIAGAAFGCPGNGDTSKCGWHVGLPFAARRGGGWDYGIEAGAFHLSLSFGPSYRSNGLGLRCCRGR